MPELKRCKTCDVVLTTENANYRVKKLGTLRAQCKFHDRGKRLYAKKKKLKAVKDATTTNGGSSKSRQKVVPDEVLNEWTRTRAQVRRRG